MIKCIALLALLPLITMQNLSPKKNYGSPIIQTVAMNFEDQLELKNYDINFKRTEKSTCGDIEALNLDDMHINDLKSNLIRSSTLRHVSIYKNNLQVIPAILNDVPKLSCLNLSDNAINIYNGNEINHSNLKALDLSNQKISEVNDLIIINNFYKHIIFNSTGYHLPKLTYLDLSGNDISSVLWDFHKSFPHLMQLDLNNINAVELEPMFFKKVPTSLRFLHLGNNNFQNVTIENMADIIALYLNDNHYLKTIDIVSEKLKILSLANCSSLSSAYAIFNTPYLEELDLSMNNLRILDHIDFEMFSLLKILLLDYNQLSQMPSLMKLPQLRELSLNFNIIKHIPSNDAYFPPSLKKLSLRGNKIERIEKDSFIKLNDLEYLDLSENRLTSLPYQWATTLINIQYLNVNSNQFIDILHLSVRSDISSLKHISVKNNLFKQITTAELATLPNSIMIYVA